MSMTYTDYVTIVANMINVSATITNASAAAPSSDPNFNTALPRSIEYAEQRIYRELDFLATRETDSTQVTTSGSRYAPIPAALVVIEGINLISPAGQAPDSVGSSRVPLIRMALNRLDMIFPSQAAAAPVFGQTCYALYDQQETSPASKIRIGPVPNGAYTVEFKGTFRPAALSATNTATFLTTNLPDLFTAAALVWWFGYQRDFGASADAADTAMSWEKQYELLKTSAAVEEARKKMLASGGAT